MRKFGDSIDWIGLSLDSGNEIIQYQLGRGNGKYVKDIINKCEMIKNEGIKLKINSVITRLNYKEDMSQILKIISPTRWKVFQVLKIKEQNCISIKDLIITKKEFEFFIEKHEFLNPIIENNNIMLNSYFMIDPKGRFYQNNGNVYNFSHSILKAGVIKTLSEVSFNHSKFLERGGIYKW